MISLLASDIFCHLVIALSAHWLVHVLSSNHLSHVLWSCADVKRGCVVAALADRLQLFDLLALWHQGDDGLEHGSHTSGVQGSNYDYLALVSCILTELSDLKAIPG